MAAVVVSPERAPEGSLIPGFLHLYPYTFYRVKAAAVFCSRWTRRERGTSCLWGRICVIGIKLNDERKAVQCEVPQPPKERPTAQ